MSVLPSLALTETGVGAFQPVADKRETSVFSKFWIRLPFIFLNTVTGGTFGCE
ncbi:hypothetical protein D3C87_1054090 [compost metagenome]